MKLFLGLLLITALSCHQSSDEKDGLSSEQQGIQESTTKQVAILKTIHGNIKIKFYSQEAPNTVKRFTALVEQGFYDGLPFHRVVPNFILQTGDPTNTGTGGSGQKIKGEINSIQHIKGTVGMARSESDNDSADSQFYISLSTLSQLDGKNTVIGQVIQGEEILDTISPGDKILSLSLETSKD
ncbi:MAG: peptidylprolyl isomerase [Bdellovibrionota bacterium]